jgi:hypothetical protein
VRADRGGFEARGPNRVKAISKDSLQPREYFEKRPRNSYTPERRTTPARQQLESF